MFTPHCSANYLILFLFAFRWAQNKSLSTFPYSKKPFIWATVSHMTTQNKRATETRFAHSRILCTFALKRMHENISHTYVYPMYRYTHVHILYAMIVCHSDLNHIFMSTWFIYVSHSALPARGKSLFWSCVEQESRHHPCTLMQFTRLFSQLESNMGLSTQ